MLRRISEKYTFFSFLSLYTNKDFQTLSQNLCDYLQELLTLYPQKPVEHEVNLDFHLENIKQIINFILPPNKPSYEIFQSNETVEDHLLLFQLLFETYFYLLPEEFHFYSPDIMLSAVKCYHNGEDNISLYKDFTDNNEELAQYLSEKNEYFFPNNEVTLKSIEKLKEFVDNILRKYINKPKRLDFEAKRICFFVKTLWNDNPIYPGAYDIKKKLLILIPFSERKANFENLLYLLLDLMYYLSYQYLVCYDNQTIRKELDLYNSYGDYENAGYLFSVYKFDGNEVKRHSNNYLKYFDEL